ncbi:hypothetical protein AMR95_11215 [Bacillus sp. G1(2015b)]|nr:hypothetical protein AMR95_11215 [Bacillus sp. G1(2015b)]
MALSFLLLSSYKNKRLITCALFTRKYSLLLPKTVLLAHLKKHRSFPGKFNKKSLSPAEERLPYL